MVRHTSGKVNKLTMAQQFELIKLVRDNYTASRAYDDEFAKTATKTLGFLVTKGNISGVRQQFGIQSNLDMIAQENAAAREAKKANGGPTRLDELEGALMALQHELRVLKQKLGEV